MSVVPESETHDNQDLVSLVLKAYRSIRAPVAYVSMSITSGRRLYDFLEEHGVLSLRDLPEEERDSFYQEVVAPNVRSGTSVADSLSGRTALAPVAPSIFEAKKHGWSQEDYMLLWLRVIEERAGEMHMVNGWQYSSGSSQEFARAVLMQFGYISPDDCQDWNALKGDAEEEYQRIRSIKVYDENSGELQIEKGTIMLRDAIFDLHSRGFDFSGLLEPFYTIVGVAAFLNSWGTFRRERAQYTAYDFNWKPIVDANSEVRSLEKVA